MDLSKTIIPKSDQLNADDLVGGAITIKITAVSGAEDEQQPVVINFAGDNKKPYKPCKTMRRLLVQLWGADGSKYVGRYITLYRDDSVKWAGVNVGGIRISHASHIEKPTDVLITVGRGKRRPTTILPISVEKPQIKDFKKALEAFKNGKVTLEALKETYTITQEQLKQLTNETK